MANVQKSVNNYFSRTVKFVTKTVQLPRITSGKFRCTQPGNISFKWQNAPKNIVWSKKSNFTLTTLMGTTSKKTELFVLNTVSANSQNRNVLKNVVKIPYKKNSLMRVSTSASQKINNCNNLWSVPWWSFCLLLEG